PVLAGVIDADPTALLDRKAAPAWKTSVSQIILRAGGRRIAEIRGPPSIGGGARSCHEQTHAAASALALRLRRPGSGGEEGLAAKQRRQFVTERVNTKFQALIEHVANHDHAALRPLSHPAEIGVIELRLGSVALDERTNHADYGLEAHRMSAGDVLQNSSPLGREIHHGRSTPQDRKGERSPLRLEKLRRCKVLIALSALSYLKSGNRLEFRRLLGVKLRHQRTFKRVRLSPHCC